MSGEYGWVAYGPGTVGGSPNGHAPDDDLKELLRQAALLAATHTPDGRELAVSAADLGAALDELLDTRNAMTRVLLGGPRKVKH